MDSLVRTCAECGATFGISGGRSWAARYCTDRCQSKARSDRQNVRRRGELLPQPCKGCGQTFQPSNTVNTWCSGKCRHKVNSQKRRVERELLRSLKRCLHCDGPLGETRTSNAVYCRACAKPSARRKRNPCAGCGKTLDGRSRTWCAKCKKSTESARNRAAIYGLSYEEYRNLIDRGACDICKTALVEKASQAQDFREVGHIDHDHVTGKVRGYLCRMCNHMLGNAKDNPERLEQAARYLRLIGE